MENYEVAKTKNVQNNDKIVQASSGVQKGQAQTTAVLAQLMSVAQQFPKSVSTSDKPNAADETKKKKGAE